MDVETVDVNVETNGEEVESEEKDVFLGPNTEVKWRNELSSWRLGDPLPLPYDPSKREIWDSVTKNVNVERRDKFVHMLAEIGDSMRNQLATPREYMAWVKHVVKRTTYLFSDMDETDFGMVFYPEVSLYVDQSAKIDGAVGVVYMSMLTSGDGGVNDKSRPKEGLWQKTLKCEFPGVVVEKMKRTKFFYPAIKNRVVPPTYCLKNILETPLENKDKDKDKDENENKDEDKKKDFSMEDEDENKDKDKSEDEDKKKDFSMELIKEHYGENEDLKGSPYLEEFFFGYVQKNGINHPSLSDSFDYSIGREEILQHRAFIKHKSKIGTKSSFFDKRSASSNDDNKLTIPFYTVDSESIESQKRKDTSGLPTNEDEIIYPDVHNISHLSHHHSDVILINGEVFRGNLMKKALEKQKPKLSHSKTKQTTIGFDTILKHLTTYRFKILMNVTNFHYSGYNIKPPNYVDNDELEKIILQQKRKYGCLPQIRWDKNLKKPKSPKINEVSGARTLLSNTIRILFKTEVKKFVQLCSCVCRNWRDYLSKEDYLRFYTNSEKKLFWLPPLLSESRLNKYENFGISLPIDVEVVESKALANIIKSVQNKRRRLCGDENVKQETETKTLEPIESKKEKTGGDEEMSEEEEYIPPLKKTVPEKRKPRKTLTKKSPSKTPVKKSPSKTPVKKLSTPATKRTKKKIIVSTDKFQQTTLSFQRAGVNNTTSL